MIGRDLLGIEDLTREEILKYAEGGQSIPPQLRDIYPAQILSSVKDRKVLCPASGGGQQSVVWPARRERHRRGPDPGATRR